jgi:hypothetical protein
MDLLLLALSPVILPDPGMPRVFIHPEVASGLGNGLIRLHGQFHRTFLECGGVFSHRGLAHRTRLVCCILSLSPCVRESIATSKHQKTHRENLPKLVDLWPAFPQRVHPCQGGRVL